MKGSCCCCCCWVFLVDCEILIWNMFWFVIWLFLIWCNVCFWIIIFVFCWFRSGWCWVECFVEFFSFDYSFCGLWENWMVMCLWWVDWENYCRFVYIVWNLLILWRFMMWYSVDLDIVDYVELRSLWGVIVVRNC